MKKFLSASHTVTLSFFMLFAASSCGNESRSVTETDPSWMRTGFYFLSDSADAVTMTKKDSDEQYKIEKTAFASVQHVSFSEITRSKVNGSEYTELCMTFDDDGRKDLEKGFGNPMHPKIAVIVANKLLYVVDNTGKLQSGKTCIGLLNYSEEEIAGIKDAVDNKR